MIARPIDAAAAEPRQYAPHARLVHAVAMILRGARALADDLGWSVWRWYQVRQSVQVLSGLDDRMLQDIGVSRPMIVTAAVGRAAEEEAIRRREPW